MQDDCVVTHDNAQVTFEAAWYEIAWPKRVRVSEALRLAEQLRRAAIKHRVANEHSEAIVGKTSAGTPLTGHAHAHYFAIDEDSDSLLDRLIVYAPGGFDKGDMEAFKDIRSVALPWLKIRVPVSFVGLGTPKSVNSRIFGSSKRWRSLTPFSLPRFPNRGGGKPPRPRDLPEAQLIRELKSRGLQEPVSIKRIQGYQPNGRPLVRWLEFHTRRFKGTHGKGLAGFEIEFAEPVSGPIALGFGCHFGLGLFEPC